MAQIINTNIASMNAQRNLSSSQNANATSLERLSSGLCINSAKDDAAGLAISTRFESQTRGLGQAVRNAGNGVSLAQTAGGALQSMTDNLQRMRELSVQAANGTNSEDDRMALQAEVSQLVEENERTAEETNFNGRNPFDGGFEGIFQIGANAGQTVGVGIGELTTDRLGTSDQVGVSGIGTADSLANGDLVINGVSIGASTSTDDTASSGTADSSNVAASGIAIAAAINRSTDSTGVTAEVNATQVVGVTEDTDDTAATQGDDLDILINNVDVGTVVSQGDRDADISNTIDLINSKSGQTGVRAENNGEGIPLLADDGRNISIAIEGTGDAVAESGAAFGLDSGEVDGIGAGADFAADAATTYSTVTLSSSNTIEVSGGTNGTEGLQSIGFTRGDFGGGNDGQFMSEVDISTFEGAQAAITAVDNALSTVSAVRSDLGAIQNRFESTNDQIISRLNSTEDFLSQQFEIMNGMLANKN